MNPLTFLTGASRGLGAAMAVQLVQPGDTLIGISRQADPSLAALAAERGTHLHQWQHDLAEPAAAGEHMAQWLRQQPSERYSSVQMINNAAALAPPGPLERQGAAELSRGVRVGLEAVLVLTQAFLQATQDWSVPRRVLNISSGLGRRPMAGSAAYCAVKAGVDHFTRALALEQAQQPNGARVVSLAPGVIDTDMQVQLRGADSAGFPERDRFVQLKVQGGLDTPEQAAAKVLAFLARADFGALPVVDVRDAPAR